MGQVPDPLPDVPTHVIEEPGIGISLGHRVRFAGITAVPSHPIRFV